MTPFRQKLFMRMPSMRILAAVLCLASPGLAVEPQVQRDLAYVEPKNERQTLDVYSPAAGEQHPIIVWVHGGGRSQGQKGGVQKKPEAFVDRGFVFVSINYRFVPTAALKEIVGDVAKAIHWVHDHAAQYGGDPNSIFVMGHSGGAHLAALVCTDERFLKAEGLSLANIKGCIPIDVGFYDVPKLVRDSGSTPPDSFKAFFGPTPASQWELSPVAYVAKDKQLPPFLILHCADRPDTTSQSDWFAQKLQDAGASAKVVSVAGKTHLTISSDLGTPDDKPTRAIFEFLDSVLKK
jgi:acetyl esterase/lipase